jgi:hypothetical protein
MVKATLKVIRRKQYARIANRYERKVLSTPIPPRETKTDKQHHGDTRSLWIRSCDAISDFKRKVFRLARHMGSFKVRRKES